MRRADANRFKRELEQLGERVLLGFDGPRGYLLYTMTANASTKREAQELLRKVQKQHRADPLQGVKP